MVLRSIHKDDLHADYLPVGHSTSLASRMEKLATPGAIVVSEYTYKLTEGYFEFRALGAAKVKGVSEPVHIYEVLGVGPLRTRLQVAARRGLARFVGRQSELEQIRRALEQTKEGHGQIVAAMGEPGVGKSRLFYEFKLRSQAGCLVLETFSVSHGKAYAYLPLIDLLKNYFQLTLQDDERKRREKITGKVLTLDRGLEDILPYLFFLLGLAEPTSSLQQMDPQIRRQRTLEAMKRLLLRESLNQPLLLIFEDLHWLDNETQAFLTLLSESVATTRIFLLVNYRPEYQHTWSSKTYYDQLRLDPLGQAEASELLTALVGDDTGLQPLKQFILEKTEGNPFFMEEIVQVLMEEGVLVRDAVGAHGVRPLPVDLHIPTTVQAVLASRIDRLPVAEKELLQTLAVIGKEFAFSLLEQVVNQPEDTLQPRLFRLQEAEFIYEQPAFPEVEYVFKHALTQDVAYTSLLLERRKILHERVAQAIEEVYREALEDHYSELAHHYSRSGNTKKAVEYLRLAGRQPMQRSANEEAIRHLTAALQLLQTLPETHERIQQELSLQIALGVPLQAMRGSAAPEVEKVYARARELCQQLGDAPQLVPVLAGLWVFYLQRGEMATTHELAEQIFTLARDVEAPALLLQAHRMIGTTLFWRGELPAAKSHLEQAITLYDPQQHRSHAFLYYGLDPGAVCLSFAGWTLWQLGYPDQSLTKSREALTLAQELAHPPTLAFVLSFTATTHRFRQEIQVVQERAEAQITLSNEQGSDLGMTQGLIQWGWALSEQGRSEEGIAQIRQGLATRSAMGVRLGEGLYLSWLAEAQAKAGQVEEGLTVLAEAMAALDETGERINEAELYRFKGELTMKSQEVQGAKFKVQSVEAEAEACFHKAIEIAQRQGAKSMELRAVMSLARLWQKQGKKKEARQRLAEIYDWFTEGFDTADLKEAKALLEELESQVPSPRSQV